MKKFLTILISLSLIGINLIPFSASANTKINSLEKGLVGHWMLDNIHKAKDLSAKGNNGTSYVSGGIGTATDQKFTANSATTFNGTSDYIELSSYNSINVSNLTFSAWVNSPSFSSGGSYQAVLSLLNSGAAEGYQVFIANAGYGGASPGELCVYTNGTVCSGLILSPNTWNFIGITVSGTSYKFYLNNQSATKTGNGITPITTILNKTFGAFSSSQYLYGLLSDVRIYNRALSTDEIALLYQTYKPKIAQDSLTKGLVGEWMLDGTHKAKDLSAKGNNGTPQGGIAIGTTGDQKGQANGATSFNGTSNYVDAGSLGTLNAPFTISEWVYFNNLTQPSGDYDYAMMMGDSSNMISISRDGSGTSNQDKFYVWTGGTQLMGPVLAGQQWAHVVLKANSSAPYLELYINGVSQTVDQPSSAIQTNGKVDIGLYKPATTHFLDGKADDVRIYNRGLSQSEITKLYQSYKPKIVANAYDDGDSSLVGVWHMEEGSGATIKDSSGHGNNGTISGASWMNDKGAKVLSFNGTSDYVSLPNTRAMDPGTGDYTWSGWLYLENDYGNYPAVFTANGGGGSSGFGFGTDTPDNRLWYEVYGTLGARQWDVFPNSNIFNKWTQLTFVLTKSDFKLKIYSDGALYLTRQLVDWGSIDSVANLYFGGYASSGNFKGKMDEPRIYKRALTAPQVQNLYKIGKITHN